MNRWPWAHALLLSTALSCDEKPASRHSPRAEVRRLTGSTLELVPSVGQEPFCLVFSRSQKGTLRQLTMTHENLSVPCLAGQPVMGLSFRVPVQEGPVKLHVFFSSQKLNAASVADQLLELQARPSWTAMDLRLPGQVHLETLEFTPAEDTTPTVGTVIGGSGPADAPDGGR